MRVVVLVLSMLLLNDLFAQNNDSDEMPYLSEDDIKSLEAILPEDIPEKPEQVSQPNEASKTIQNEISRLNSSAMLYHLLIVDRNSCAPNADITGINETDVLYKFKHLENGYLVLLYKVPEHGPIFPIFPKGSYVILDLMTNRINTIREYINSEQFRKFISSQEILSGINRGLE
jgi:hypothetical protein